LSIYGPLADDFVLLGAQRDPNRADSLGSKAES
jgi:hypothetical protein